MKHHGLRLRTGQCSGKLLPRLWLIPGLLFSTSAVAQEIEDGFPFALISSIYYAEDLAPEETLFSQPHEARSFRQNDLALNRLAKLLTSNFWVRMIAIPGAGVDEADFAVSLTSADSGVKYQIVWDQLSVPTSWYQALDSTGGGLPESFDDSTEKPGDAPWVQAIKRKINQALDREPGHCEVPVSDRLGDRIARLWTVMVGRAHYSDPEKEGHRHAPSEEGRRGYGFDFHFVSDWKRSARTLDLFRGTRPDLMVTSALAMRDYCRTKDEKYLVALTQALDGLERKLPQKLPKKLPRKDPARRQH